MWSGAVPESSRLKSVPDPVARLLWRESLLAMGLSRPNPPVACVVETQSGQYFSGATERAGGRHAEIVALDAYDASGGADPFRIYVTLEPCSRFGRTPPCLIRLQRYNQLQEVVFLHRDPTQNSLTELQKVCTVSQGNLSSFFLEGFLRRVQRNRPRLFFKIACSKDGFIAPFPLQRFPISGRQAMAFVQLLRSRMSAIAVGERTIQIDRPRLNYRPPSESDLPRPADRKGSAIFLDTLFDHADLLLTQQASLLQPLRIGCLDPSRPVDQDFLREQENTGSYASFDSRRPAAEFLSFVADLGCSDLMVEGGAGLFSYLKEHLEGGDVLLLLQSRSVELGDGLALPAVFQKAQAYSASYQIGGDTVYYREMDS